MVGEEGLRQIEIEALASPNGVVSFIEIIRSVYPEATSAGSNDNILSSLRIYDMQKVKYLRFFGNKNSYLIL